MTDTCVLLSRTVAHEKNIINAKDPGQINSIQQNELFHSLIYTTKYGSKINTLLVQHMCVDQGRNRILEHKYTSL